MAANSRMSILLEEVAHIMGVSQLEPDQFNGCTISCSFPEAELRVQIEPDGAEEQLRLLSYLGNIGPGRYGEVVLYEALRMNGDPLPLHGTLAFDPTNNQLCLCEKLPLQGLRGALLAEELTLFLQKAKQWKELLDKGELPRFSEHPSSNSPMGLFSGGSIG